MDNFKVFIPFDLYVEHVLGSGYDIYVAPSDNLGHYVGHRSFDQPPASSGTTIEAWTWESWQAQAPLSSGSLGTRYVLSLRIDGFRGQAIETYAHITYNRDSKDIEPGLGGPIRIKGADISPSYELTHREHHLEFEVPYNRLSKIPWNQCLTVTPAIVVRNRILEGNIHFLIWPDGPIYLESTQLTRYINYQDQYNQSLQEEINLLKAEAGQ